MNLPPVDNWVTNVACQICDLVADDPVLGQLYSVWGPGYRSTADAKPVTNDLLVWWEPAGGCDPAVKSSPGHVAVVTATDASNIFYIQQNWIEAVRVAGSAYASLARTSTPWDATTHMFGHAGGSGGDGFRREVLDLPGVPARYKL